MHDVGEGLSSYIAYLEEPRNFENWTRAYPWFNSAELLGFKYILGLYFTATSSLVKSNPNGWRPERALQPPVAVLPSSVDLPRKAPRDSPLPETPVKKGYSGDTTPFRDPEKASSGESPGSRSTSISNPFKDPKDFNFSWSMRPA
jgi:hypothetical protein